MHQSDPAQGELSFELLAEIAVGSTARVELCRVIDGPLERELVAVKRLHPHIAEDPQFVDMFRDEVWMTAALKHPHVVEVVGWGQDGVGPWLAVEFVRGVSLARLMKTVFETGERFTERMVVYLARCMCDGLASAHSLCSASGEHLNLVHRDLTPGNILLSFDGHVKITDFGLAKAKQRLTKTLTGLLKGQPQYMSPEQVQGGTLDGRSDIFALGVVLFELFSGRRPWPAVSDLDVMRAITDEPPDDLAELRPRIDRALVEIVERCLQKAPGDRFQSARELSERFDGWLNAHGYRNDNHVSLARFVRRNAMRQMRWFERAIAGEFMEEAQANQPMPVRMSQAPGDLPPRRDAAYVPPPASSARTHPREDAARARDDRGAPEVPPLRPEAPTRVNDDKTADQRGRRDSIDWGDDGPTLIQKSESARRAIAALSSRQKLVESADAPTARTRRDTKPIPRRQHRITDAPTALRDSIDAEDSSELETAPGRRQDVIAAIEALRGRGADGTGATEAMARVDGTGATEALGVVAPPDPEVPPLPPSPPRRPRAATAPLRASPSGDPPPQRAHRGADYEAAPPADDSAPRLRAAPSAAEVYAKESDPGEGTRPMSTDDLDAARSLEHGLRLPGVGAMPVPRFPSLPSLVEERSKDFQAEAQRLGHAAKLAGAYAEAAARAARLAAEAVLAAAAGQRAEAIVKLRDAQNIEDALARGETSPRDIAAIAEPAGRGDAPLGPLAAPLSAVQQLSGRERATLLLAIATGVLAVALLIALFV